MSVSNQSTRTLLTDTQMCVDGGVTYGTRQVLVLPIGDVKVGLRVVVFLGETQVYQQPNRQDN